jgi:hypothetical protein
MSEQQETPTTAETEPAAAPAAAPPETGGAGAAAPAAEPAGPPDLEQVRAWLGALKGRMEQMRSDTEEEVLKSWQSPWRGADAVKAKVDARLASNAEYRRILTDARNVQILADQLDPDFVDPAAGKLTGGHPAIGR